jgi:hypothetical protein
MFLDIPPASHLARDSGMHHLSQELASQTMELHGRKQLRVLADLGGPSYAIVLIESRIL